MNLKKVHHIAIIGSNYEKSRRFYVDLLGFSVIRENYRPERDDYKIDLQLDGMELELFRKKKLTKTNVKELLEGKETLVKGIKNKEKKPYNAVVKIGEKGYIDFISFSK